MPNRNRRKALLRRAATACATVACALLAVAALSAGPAGGSADVPAADSGTANASNGTTQARRWFAEGRYAQALVLLDNYCDRHREDHAANALRARVCLAEGERLKASPEAAFEPMAEKAFDIGRALMAAPDAAYFAEGLFICGRALCLNGRLVKGGRYLKKAIGLTARPPAEYLVALGDLFAARGKPRLAVDTYRRAASLEGEDPDAALAGLKLGRLLVARGERGAGRAALQAALKRSRSPALTAEIMAALEALDTD